MYARSVTGRLKLASLEHGLLLLDRDVRPLVGTRPGFQGWELLVDRASGRFQAVSYWGCRTEAEGAGRDGFTDRAGALASLLEGPVNQVLFEVLQKSRH